MIKNREQHDKEQLLALANLSEVPAVGISISPLRSAKSDRRVVIRYPIAVQNGLRLEIACQTGLSLTRQRDRFL